MKIAIRRRDISSVMLLAMITRVLRYRTGGKVKCRQSDAPPWRTIRALVKAAKLMVMAAKATQMPVLAGGGEESLTLRKSPLAGTIFRQPPLPEPWLGRRSCSIFGGSWTVVAILVYS